MSTQKPESNTEKVRTVIKESNVDVGSIGYSEEINEEIASRWGPDETLDRQQIYDVVNRIQQQNGHFNEGLLDINGIGRSVAIALSEAGYETKRDLQEASQTELETVQNVGTKTAQRIKEDVDDRSDDDTTELETDEDSLGVVECEFGDCSASSPVMYDLFDEQEGETEPGTPEERVRLVLKDDEGLLQDAARGERVVNRVVQRVKDRYGLPYTVTEGTVSQVVGTMRERGELPSRGDDITEAGPDSKILYICELCGLRDSDPSEVRKHIASADDAAHADRNGHDTHLISSTVEPLEQPDRFDGEVDDGFEVAWTIYNNPEAQQDEIADVLGISTSTLINRLEDLGIDWEDRETQVKSVLPNSIARERIERGNVTVDVPFGGIDGTNVSYLADTDLPKTRTDVTVDVSLSLTPSEAFQFVNGDEEVVESVQKNVFRQTMETACSKKESFFDQLSDTETEL